MLRITLVLFLASAGFGFASSLPDSDWGGETSMDVKQADQAHNSAANAPARLTVHVPQKVVAGSPLPIEARVVNRGNTPFWARWWTTDPMKLHVKLTTKDGKPVPFTAYGRELIAPTYVQDLAELRKKAEAQPNLRDELERQAMNIKRKMADRSVGSFRGHEVLPGEDYDLGVPNLALYYDLTLPGEYFVTVSYSVSVRENGKTKSVKLGVNNIPFTIIEPPWWLKPVPFPIDCPLRK